MPYAMGEGSDRCEPQPFSGMLGILSWDHQCIHLYSGCAASAWSVRDGFSFSDWREWLSSAPAP